jgi:hypothetical protein
MNTWDEASSWLRRVFRRPRPSDPPHLVEAYKALVVEVVGVKLELASALREADRLRHVQAIEGDYVCPDSLRADEAEKERARARRALVFAHCDLRALAGLAGKGSVALRVNELQGFDGEWERRTVGELRMLSARDILDRAENERS